MRLSVREAKARFSEAISAAQNGEQVVITKQGAPVVKLVATGPEDGESNWDRMARARKELGLDKLRIDLPPNFNDPAFSRQVLGLDE